MKIPLVVSGLAALCTFAASAAQTNPSASSNKAKSETRFLRLDTAAIHALYMDGEFESAIRQLEGASADGLLKSHSDSVFAYKHLGVMYAAQYETMEKGKSYMYRLLSIEPSVKILDMYASDMIYMIFRNVQTEYQIRTARLKKSDTVVASQDSSYSEVLAAKTRKSKWKYWTAAAALAAGAGITTYIILRESPAQTNHFDGGL